MLISFKFHFLALFRYSFIFFPPPPHPPPSFSSSFSYFGSFLSFFHSFIHSFIFFFFCFFFSLFLPSYLLSFFFFSFYLFLHPLLSFPFTYTRTRTRTTNTDEIRNEQSSTLQMSVRIVAQELFALNCICVVWRPFQFINPLVCLYSGRNLLCSFETQLFWDQNAQNENIQRKIK